jgi:cytochrome P450
LLTGYFSVRRVNELRAIVEAIVDDCIDGTLATGSPVDFVDAFARPVPSRVLCAVLGVPASDRDVFERLTWLIHDPEEKPEGRIAAFSEFRAYCGRLINSKSTGPATDLLGELLQGGQLQDDELTSMVLTLLSAGHDTTANMLGLSAFALLSDRRQWESLRADPDLIEAGVEELLRYLTIVPASASRTALEDVEIEGVLIRAGQSVIIALPAANRDPEVFDDPDHLKLRRDATGHLALGSGRHICLGQHLARLELQVSLRTLMRRLPTLRLAAPASDVPFHNGEYLHRGVRHLPVSW